jgi:hypothetical protein
LMIAGCVAHQFDRSIIQSDELVQLRR